MRGWAVAAAAVLAAPGLHLALRTELAAPRAVTLLAGAVPEGFREVMFVEAVVPRTLMAGLVGPALGRAGSVPQQLTRNRLVSPLTIGAASGVWLALVVAGLPAPALVLAIAGRRGVAGCRSCSRAWPATSCSAPSRRCSYC